MTGGRVPGNDKDKERARKRKGQGQGQGQQQEEDEDLRGRQHSTGKLSDWWPPEASPTTPLTQTCRRTSSAQNFTNFLFADLPFISPIIRLLEYPVSPARLPMAISREPKFWKLKKIWPWVSNSKIPEVSWVFHYLMQRCVCWPMLCDWRIVQWVSIKLHKSEDSKHERKVQPKGQSGADQCLKTFRHCVWKHYCQAENSLLSIQISSLQKYDQQAFQQMALWSLWDSFKAKP